MKEQAGQPVFNTEIDSLLTERIVAHSRATVSPETPAQETASEPPSSSSADSDTIRAPRRSALCKPTLWAIAAALAAMLAALILYRLRRRR